MRRRARATPRCVILVLLRVRACLTHPSRPTRAQASAGLRAAIRACAEAGADGAGAAGDDTAALAEEGVTLREEVDGIRGRMQYRVGRTRAMLDAIDDTAELTR